MKNILTRLEEWEAGVRLVQDNGVPLNGAALSALLVDCSALLVDVKQVLVMVDTNNRIAAGENKTAFNRARKAWNGAFVVREVQRVLVLLTPNAQAHRQTAPGTENSNEK